MKPEGVLNTTDEAIATIVPAKIMASEPYKYRLARKRNGELILQGCYSWHQGDAFGEEWRYIPIAEVEDE